MTTVIVTIVILAAIIGLGSMLMNLPIEIKGYPREYLERVLGCVKVGGESFVGRFIETIDGVDTYLIMTRNDDLEPPHQVSRTIQCPDCKCMVLPIGGCACQLSNSKTPKALPIFKDTAVGSFAHQYFAGYPEKAKKANV